MVILTLNCGSSSAKYQVYDWDNKDVLASGVVERVTQEGSAITHIVKGRPDFVKQNPCPTHAEAVELIISVITGKDTGVIKDMSVIEAVGHRLVHGGNKFIKSVIITPEVIKTFRELQDLAPLHNPANILGIEGAQKVLPNVPHCAIMDTAWHQTMPAMSYMYALPYEWYEKYNVRKFGFHGTSFIYTARRASVLLHKIPADTNVIIAHIGNGASLCAVKDGQCYDTTMGMTPLQGLVMGTRCGTIDPSIPFYMMRKTGMSLDKVDNALNKQSGLLGLSGKYTDMRDIVKAVNEGDAKSKLAFEIECYRVRKYVGSYVAAIGKVDALVFTAGIGEFGFEVREEICKGLEPLGIILDGEKNKLARTRNAETCISSDYSPIKIFVIPTDEELVMTEDTFALKNGTYDVHTNFTYTFQSHDYVNKARAEGLKKDLEKNPSLAKILAT
ncbi:MAG: acetate kinase [Treponemataceae bacterium]|nr:MAG: acetate kinase [Treponemataceae bacterium]